MADRTVYLDLIGRDKASGAFDSTGKSAEKTGSKVQAASKAAKVALVGMAGAAIAFGKSSVDAFKESEVSQGKLTEAYRKFPAMADASIESLRELNSTLALKTKYDDDASASAQSVLAGFKLTGSQVRDLTPLLQDYAAKTGKDLPAAAKDLGKAVMGQGKALKNIGLDFKDTGDRGKNFDQIMSGLRTQVGGYASSEGKTAAGQTEILKNQFGELQEAVGAQLMPVLSKGVTVLMSVATWVGNNQGKALALAGAVVGVTAAVAGINVAMKVWRAGVIAYTAAQWLMNSALIANPIGLVVLAIAALVGALVIAYKKSDTFRKIVDAAFKGVATAASVAFGWIKSNWPKLLAIVTGPIGIATALIVKNWTKIRAGAQLMAESVKQAFLKMALAVGQTIEKVLDVASRVPGIGDKFRRARDSVRASNEGMQSSIDRSKQKVNELKNAMAGIKSKSVNVTINTQIKGQTGWFDPRNHGGGSKATANSVGGLSVASGLNRTAAGASGMSGGVTVNIYPQVAVGSSREFRDMVIAALNQAGLRGAIA